MRIKTSGSPSRIPRPQRSIRIPYPFSGPEKGKARAFKPGPLGPLTGSVEMGHWGRYRTPSLLLVGDRHLDLIHRAAASAVDVQHDRALEHDIVEEALVALATAQGP